MNSPHVFLAFTQGKRRINRTFFHIRKRTVNAGFTWYSPFGKIDGERGLSCRVFVSEQPKKKKMAFVSILSQIKLLFGPLAIQLVRYILKQLFTSVSVTVETLSGDHTAAPVNYNRLR